MRNGVVVCIPFVIREVASSILAGKFSFIDIVSFCAVGADKPFSSSRSMMGTWSTVDD